MTAYSISMNVRRLLALFLALSVLFAPAMTGAAMASSQHHDMQLMQAGHCEAPPAKSADHDKMAGKTCCIAMCTALAIAPASPVLDHEARPALAVFANPTWHLAFLGEIATPPPRNS